MARQSSGRHNTEDADGTDTGSPGNPGAARSGVGETGSLGTLDADPIDDELAGDAGADAPAGRDAATAVLWEQVRIEPVEIALPRGTGYTLRAYRPAAELRPTEAGEDEDDPFAMLAAAPHREDEEIIILDDTFAEEVDDDDEALRNGRRSRREQRGDEDDPDGEAGADAEADLDAGDDAEAEEDVPVFLSHRGKVFLFRTPESLVEFVRSGAEHDLAQLDSWPEVAERIRPEDVVPVEEDTYELDLVVENLRGGHDVWDPDLLIEAGEIARDLAYALRLEAVQTALAPGSPLDDLDEALRTAAAGGLGGFLARRRLRKIGAQQATLGWRTIIGKISSAVVWRE